MPPFSRSRFQLRHQFQSIPQATQEKEPLYPGGVIDLNREFYGIDFPDPKDLKIKRDNNVWTIEANYDDQAPLFSNIAILVTFDKIVRLKGGGGE